MEGTGTARRAAITTLVVISIVVVALALWKIRLVIALVFLAFTLAAAMRPGVEWLQRRARIPRGFGVLLHYVVVRRMWRPVGTVAAKVLEKRFNGTFTTVQGRIKRDLQSGDNRIMMAAPGMLRQHAQASFGCHHLRSMQFALGHKRLNRKDKLIVAPPSLFA